MSLQWWYGQKESRITAAIEISRNYFSHANSQTRNAMLASDLNVINSPDDAALAVEGDNFLEYVAFLANDDRIDKRLSFHRYEMPHEICLRRSEEYYSQVPLPFMGSSFRN
jgi:hypothetical protein